MTADRSRREALVTPDTTGPTFRESERWRELMIRAELAVCRIECPEGNPGGTGFLVAENVVLTCDHVLVDGKFDTRPDKVWCRFDHCIRADGVTTAGVPVPLAKDWVVHRSPEDQLDYALLQLAPGDRGSLALGWVARSVNAARVGQVLYIIQHPEGRQRGFDEGELKRKEGNRLLYRIDTQDGSSGSPVFNKQWQLVGVHTSKVTEEKLNKGVDFQKIWANLPADVRARFTDPPRLAAPELRAYVARNPSDPARIVFADRLDGPAPPPPVNTTKFPPPASRVYVGRKDYPALLDRALASRAMKVLQLVADGGLGKSTILWHWMEGLKPDYKGITQLFAWSFHSQGTQEQANAELFVSQFAAHLRRCDPAALRGYDAANEEWEQGVELANAFAAIGGVVVLDGLEPLQKPPAEEGAVTDRTLRAFLLHQADLGLARQDPTRLIITTSRWANTELKRRNVGTIHEVKQLSDEEGMHLLQQFRLKDDRKLVYDSADEASPEWKAFAAVVRANSGHPLGLLLTASFLLRYKNGDVTQYASVPDGDSPLNNPTLSKHAARVMAGYDRMFDREGATHADRACRQMLALLGLMTRPVPVRVLRVLLEDPPIPGLTDALTVAEGQLQATLHDLQSYRLISPVDAADDDAVVVTHALLRQQYAHVLRAELRDAARHANERLYRHFRSSGKRDELLEAVGYGSKAGLRGEVYRADYERLFRDPKTHTLRKQDPAGPMLSAVSWFYDLSEGGQPQWGNLPVSPDDVQPEPEPNHALKDTLTAAERHAILNDSGELLTAARGHGTQELKHLLPPATELATAGQTPRIEQFRTYYVIWNYNLAQAKFDDALTAATVAEGLARDPEMSGFPEAVDVARTNQGIVLIYKDHFGHAESFLEEPLPSPPDPPVEETFRQMFAQDIHVARGCYAAWLRAIRGRLQSALSLMEETVRYAKQYTPPFSQAATLHFLARIHCLRLEPDACIRVATELGQLSTKVDVPVWKAGGLVSYGWAVATRGKVKDGLSSRGPGRRSR